MFLLLKYVSLKRTALTVIINYNIVLCGETLKKKIAPGQVADYMYSDVDGIILMK